MRSGEPFAFAGLWESWAQEDDGGEELRTCAILTTAPNPLAAGGHDRMPVILGPEDHGAWLDPGFGDVEALREMLRPYPEERMEAYPVSRRVNRPGNDGPELLAPAA